MNDIYILDTNILSDLIINKSSHKIYENLWLPLEMMIENGEVQSVREVYNELDVQILKSGKNYNKQWILDRKRIFVKPDNTECILIKKIFKDIPKLKDGIKPARFKDGGPTADAFLIASAKVRNAILVSAEEYKPNSEKIPCICRTLGVKFMSRDNFYELLYDKFQVMVNIIH